MPESLDFGGIAFEPIPEGVYDVLIEDADWSERPTKAGEDMIRLKMMVLNDDPPGTPEDEIVDGRILFDQWVIPGTQAREQDAVKWKKRMFFLQKNLEIVTGMEWRSNGMVLEPAVLHGQLCKVLVKVGEYNNQPTNNIESYIPMTPEEKMKHSGQGSGSGFSI